MNTSVDRFELVRRVRDGDATTEEIAGMEARLLEDEDFRKIYIRYTNLEVALSSAAIIPPTGNPITIESKPDQNTVFALRSLFAGIIGLMIGLGGASLLFAFGFQKIFRQPLEISNAGFEDTLSLEPNSIPLEFGVWSGDYADVVGAQQGIVPLEGEKMLQFLRSDSKRGDTGTPYNGNLYQLIDVSNLRKTIERGAVVDWSASFNNVKNPADVATTFEASMWAFNGESSFVRQNWEEKLHQELAYSSWRVDADGDVKSWQQIRGTLFVPPDTDFLVIELKVLPKVSSHVGDAWKFSGHFADDVQLFLRTDRSNQAVN